MSGDKRDIGKAIRYLFKASDCFPATELSTNYYYGGTDAVQDGVKNIADAIKNLIIGFRCIKSPSDEETESFERAVGAMEVRLDNYNENKEKALQEASDKLKAVLDSINLDLPELEGDDDDSKIH